MGVDIFDKLSGYLPAQISIFDPKIRFESPLLTMGVAVVDEIKVVFMSNLMRPPCVSSGRF
jgi:hypothetical protein